MLRWCVVVWVLANAVLCFGVCLPIHEAQNHIGETRCVTGKVVRIAQGDKGVHFLDFCENHNTCPFTVVVFPSDLRYIGDVRQLTGKTVEIHGPVKLYDGRAEIILNDLRQLKGDGVKLPPLPKTYDVERKGRYSPGTFIRAKPARQKAPKRQTKPVAQNDPSETESSE